MDNKSNHKEHHLFTVILTILCVTVFAIINITTIRNPETVFDFVWNPYFILSLFSLIANIAILVLMQRAKVRGAIGMWFSVFLISSILWALTSAIARLSATAPMYQFWGGLTSVVAVTTAPLFLLFVLAYTRNNNLLNRWSTLAILLFSACFIIYFNGGNNLLWDMQDPNQERYSWGYSFVAGDYYPLLVIYFETIYLYCVYLLIKYYQSLKSRVIRKQTLLVIIGTLIPIIGGTTGDLILPLFGIIVTPLSVVFLTLECAVISYAMIRYHLFDYDPVAIGAVMVDSVAEGLAFIDDNDRIIQLNTTGGQLLGVDAQKILGKDWRNYAKLYHGSHKQEVSPRWRPDTNDESKSSTTVEVSADQNLYLGAKATSAFPVAMTITHLHGRDTGGTVIAFRDITKDKQATRIIERAVETRTEQLSTAQAQLMASVNSLKQGFIVTNSLGESILSNDTARTLFKHKGDILTINEVAAILEGKIELAKVIRKTIDKKTSRSLLNVPFGEKFLSIYLSPIIMKGSSIGATLLIEDVTEARVLDRSKDEFFSIASHELRTPLTAIRGNTKMIDEYYSDAIQDKDVKAMISDIYESSVRLIEIVNDFLDVSRLEQGKTVYKLEPVAIDKIVEIIVYEMTAVARVRGISLSTDKTLLGGIPPIYADQNKVKQVLYNLVGNALKFTKEGSIDISIEVLKNNIKILVTDTGRGISKEGQALLFHKFQQAGNSLFTRDTTKGTGLGLYICKLLAEGMGGKVALEKSQPGKGSVFSLTLPIATKTQIKNQKISVVEKTVNDAEHREVLLADFASEDTTPSP